MFPEPVDHGIAQPDRAVSSVEYGTDTTPDKPKAKREEKPGAAPAKATKAAPARRGRAKSTEGQPS